GGDRLGRRRTLAALAALTAAGGFAAARAEGAGVLAAIAFVGLLNGFGRDRGAALVLETAALPGLVDARRRTIAIAIHNVLQDTGHALGSVLVAVVPAGGSAAGREGAAGFHLYALLLVPGIVLAATLSARVEHGTAGRRRRERLSPESRSRLARICALFAVDSFAGGFLSSALLAWFFFERFGAGPAAIGMLFAAARAANALSHLGAAWLARRIGLVNTMVFTHLPSSLLLATVPFAPSFPIAAALFLVREGLVEMDVPTRQSYVLGILRPEERTFASGATHLVRTLGWSLGPVAAGAATARFGLAAPLVVAAALKIGYDLALWRSFRALRPPEEEPVASTP
ncbi:MAG TPA: MFS transporter, partial [Thermoanaerobaculia bacterium]|nr:MFS transporter [Thermoanaerobaculia bacterium]